MPVEIKELVIKATVRVDWENQSITTKNEGKGCIQLPADKKIVSYVKQYFRKNKTKKMVFNKSALSAFLIEWKDSLPVFAKQ